MICTSCGTSNDDTSVTCTQCGAPLTPPAQGMPQAPPPSQAGPPPQAPPPSPAWPPPQAGPPSPAPKSSRHPGLVIGIAVAAVIVLAAVATGAILVFGGSSSPDTVAQDSLNALLSRNLSSFCHYLLPNEQPACTSSMSKVPQAAFTSGHLSVAETRIQGNEALVSFVGKACIKFPANASPSRKPVTHCQSLSNPSAGMPPGAGSFQHALSNRAGVTAGDVIVALEKYNGHWYVDDRSFANTNGAG